MLYIRSILMIAFLAQGLQSLAGQTDMEVEARQPGPMAPRFYVGISAGYSSMSLGSYSYWLPLGISACYNGGNHSVSLNYSRLLPLSISLGSDSPFDYTPHFDRVEALYAYSLRVGGSTGFFRGMTIGATTGASLNFMTYKQEWWLEPVQERVVGIPLGILATNPPGEPVYGGIQVKAHFLKGHTPNAELVLFMNGAIF